MKNKLIKYGVWIGECDCKSTYYFSFVSAFGISSKLWDYIFLTFVKVKKLNFSLNWDF